jgi:hypothetical protein
VFPVAVVLILVACIGFPLLAILLARQVRSHSRSRLGAAAQSLAFVATDEFRSAAYQFGNLSIVCVCG